MNANELKSFTVSTGYGARKVVSGPYRAASIAEMVKGLAHGQRTVLTKVTENVYENPRGHRFTVAEVA